MTEARDTGGLPDGPAPMRPRSKMRDFWTLHVPLVLVVSLCVFATIVEGRRALDGNWRAVFYTFEWPLIGGFAIIVWNRYRRHGLLSLRFRERWQRKIAAFADEDARAQAQAQREAALAKERSTPEAQAWQEHVARLNREEGTPDVR